MTEHLAPAVVWRKSSRSADGGSHCVEVAGLDRVIMARDSKDPGGPVLRLSRDEWGGFVGVIASRGSV